MSVTASKYINNSKSKKSYIGLYQYSRPIRSKEDVNVNIYGLLSVSSTVEIPGDKITKFAWDGIVDGFEYSKLDSVNESLKVSLNEATRRVKQLILNDKDISQNGVDINFTVFVSNNGGIYIGVLGDADIFVYKNRRLIDIFEMLSKKRARTAGIALEENDLLFSSTKGFLKENIKKLMSAKSSEELITVLEELGREVGDDEGFVLLSKEKEKVIEKQIFKKKENEELTSQPPSSDYIPVSKPASNILNSHLEEKDLKSFFKDLRCKFGNIFKKVKEILKPLEKIPFYRLKSVVGVIPRGYISVKEKVFAVFGRKRWFKKVSSSVSQSNIVRRRNERFKGFRIDGYKQSALRFQRIKIFLFVVLGIVLIFLGVEFTLQQKEILENTKIAKGILKEVEGLIEEANSKAGTDRDASILNIYKAEEELKKLPENIKEEDLKKAEEIKGSILILQDSLYKRVRLSSEEENISKYLDLLTLQGADSMPSDISIYRDANGNEYLFVADVGLKSTYRVSLYNKEVVVLPDEKKLLKKPTYIYSKSSGIYVLDLESGVIKYNPEGNWYQSATALTGLSLEDIDAGDIAEFAVLTTVDNVYVLDREGKALLKSSNYGTGYGLSSTYLESDTFESANDVFSDISVYVLTKGEGGIHRYISDFKAGGLVESPVSLKGLDIPLKNPKYGFTADDLNKGLYIYDSEDKRVLKFEKPMESGELRHPNELLLIKQYVFPQNQKWEDVKDFVVDFKEENMYILNDTTIWKVRL